jgi:membrane-associated phospholipid phosphatase
MRSIWHHPWFMIPTLLFFGLGLWVTLTVPYSYEIIALNGWRQEPLNTFFRYMTKLGEPYCWTFLAIGAGLVRLRFAFLLALAGLLLSPTIQTLKHHIGVPRPNTYYDLNHLQESVVPVPGVKLNGGNNSFPSGHTAAAFCIYSLLALCFGRIAPVAGLVFVWTAILVGVSRIFLVQHFMADVLAGCVVGLLISDFVWQLDRRFFYRCQWLDWRMFGR